MQSEASEYDQQVKSGVQRALLQAGLEKGLAQDIVDIVDLAQKCAKTEEGIIRNLRVVV